LNHKVEKRQKE